MSNDPTEELLRRCGLELLGTVGDPALPTPARAWQVTVGVAAPTAAVPFSGDDLAGRVDAAWLRHAQEAVLSPDGTFLVALHRSRPWNRVRLTTGVRLAEHLTGDGAAPGRAEFVTMGTDGRALCGVTTEDDGVWIVVDRTLLHAAPPAPAPVDPHSLSPLQADRAYAPDRLRPPLEDGWVLLGFHRSAGRLARLHELPPTTELPAPAAAPTALDDASAHALAAAAGAPADTARLAYYLEHQTAAAKATQTGARRPPS
ncbi:hypothetical protein ACFV6F_09040 [Kitasatospora phosalacinea]|uniref:hypothetical protein n=1 Tax=Kitasatospora phosalacinea TaxID=2065 RepID=UPI00365CBF82